MMIRTIPLLLLMLLGTSALQAQMGHDEICRHNDLSLVKPLEEFTTGELQRMAADEAELEAFTQEFVSGYSEGQRNNYVVTVVFHIIHDNGPENISDAQVHDAMRILNEDFNKLNPDWTTVKAEFLDIVADVGVEFRLARKDPQGNCTNGITRTQSLLTYEGNQQMKNLIQWPRNRYLNVWVSAVAGGANTLGYTYRPGAVNNSPTWDGIVMRHNAMGTIGSAVPSWSRTLTHEVGHWINLPHTWGNSNTPALATNCNDDDGVEDTPNTIGWQNCNQNGVTCGSLDNVHNYMDYSGCARMFTNGQGARMIAALNSTQSQRNNLWQPGTLALTGVEGDLVLCEANFATDNQVICAGSAVTFTDVSFHGVESRTWEFPGGTPSTSTDEVTTVIYDAPGTYPVTLTVSDGTNSLSTTQNATVTVLANPGAATPVLEGFEDYSDLAGSPWTVVNPNNNATFAITSTAAYNGAKSVRMLNSVSISGQTNELVSNTYDMSDVNGITISYRYAYAQRAAGNDDRLRMYVSHNCGDTWSLRQQLRGINTLNTGGTVSGSFIPGGQDQWGYAEVNNISAINEVGQFRFKFEFVSDGGNNVYIDDININGAPVSVEELLPGNGTGLMVVPNPAEGQAQAVFQLAQSGQVQMELLDVLGRRLQVLHDGHMVGGEHRLDLPIAGLQGGMYFVRLQHAGKGLVQRFIVK
jgi:PKD repeat protein